MEKVKKTWVTESSFEEIKELCKKCEDQEFVMFIKEHHKQSIPAHYFTKFGWIKFRFDDLFYQWKNSNNPKEDLLEYLKIEKTYPEYYNEEEDCLDFGDYDLSTGCNVGEKPSRSFSKREEPKHTFNNQKLSPSKVIENNNVKKDLLLLVKSYEEVPLAMKCILWSLKNEPQTTYALYSNIEFIDGVSKRKFTSDEYKNILNPIIDQAVKDKVLDLKIVPKDNKKVFLYSNPSNKRIGYFYDGKLWSVKELSKELGINENTLYSRLAKYDIYKAITGV